MMQVLSVRDIKTDVFSNPMFVNSTKGAIRAFGDEIAKKDGNPLSVHPDDYELMHLGQWDEFTGKWDIFPVPRQLVAGSSLKVG